MNAAFQMERLAEQVVSVTAAMEALIEERDKARNAARHLLYLIERLPEGYPDEVRQMRRDMSWLRVELKFITQYQIVEDGG